MKARILLATRNYAGFKQVSHVGLGISALNTSKVLRQNGIMADAVSVVDANELRTKIKDSFSTDSPVTHVIISALWVPTVELMGLSREFPQVHFAVNCHSNVGFLQVEPKGIKLFREALDLDIGSANFHAAGNSEKFARWVENAYGVQCDYLPNLYFLENENVPFRPLWDGGVLKIGSFGATRAQKNILSNVAAAVTISYELKAQTEIWVNTGRTEGQGGSVLDAVRAITVNVPNVKLVEYAWSAWPAFKQVVAGMHLLVQCSYTESFSIVTADAAAQGVPCVVSEAIPWMPNNFMADVDDVFEIAHCGRRLLADRYAGKEGFLALIDHNQCGLKVWQAFIDRTLGK